MLTVLQIDFQNWPLLVTFMNYIISFSEGDTKNYLAYYQRATVYLALGRHRQALTDFDTVIKIKPDFHRVSFITQWNVIWKENTLLQHIIIYICFSLSIFVERLISINTWKNLNYINCWYQKPAQFKAIFCGCPVSQCCKAPRQSGDLKCANSCICAFFSDARHMKTMVYVS